MAVAEAHGARNGPLYDGAALALRCAALLVAAEAALAGGELPGPLSAALLAAAAAVAAGFAPPVSGGILAALALAAVPGAIGADAAAPLLLLAAAGLTAAVAPGRWSVGSLTLRRSERGAGTPDGGCTPPSGEGAREPNSRRPEEAPPLPYSEGRGAAPRPRSTT